MSVSTLSYDVDKAKYLLDLRMFFDDFMVVNFGGAEADYQPNSILKRPSKGLIEDYVLQNLSIIVDGEIVTLKIDKIKFEELTIYITFELSTLKAPAEIESIIVKDTIFVDRFVNQRNVLHIELPNQSRRSLLFNAHQREEEITWP